MANASTTTSSSSAGSTAPNPADSSGGEPLPLDCEYSESFDLADGSPWPAPWVDVGGTMLADVQGGRARLLPIVSGFSLARMYAPIRCVNVEATFAFELTDDSTQGAGFYVRQNGGYLQETSPPGAGYSTFIEKFREPNGIGVWREVDGIEQMLEPIVPMTVRSGVPLRARLRVTQRSPSSTLLQARFWEASAPEPDDWQVERTDDTPGLQGFAGGLVLDAWSNLTAGTPSEMFFDDIVVTEVEP